MTRGEPADRPVRRILVALDASPLSLSALEAAVELAVLLEAEIEGLYVEDADLLRLAGISLVREIDALSAEPRVVDRTRLERQLRLQARRARRALESAAVARQLRWSFRTARGRVALEVRTAAAEADLLILGVRSATPGRGPGSTVRAVLREPTVPVMLLGRRARLGRTVFVIHDGSAAGRRALAVAADLSARGDRGLTVMLPVPEGGSEGSQAAGVEARELGAEIRAVRLPGPGGRIEPRHLAAVLHTARCGLVVVPLSALPEKPAALGKLLGAVDCPVLLVG